MIREGSKLLAVLLAILSPMTVMAQSLESDLPEGYVSKEPASFVIPDVSEDLLDSTSYVDEKDRFSFKLGIAALVDYTGFDQDAANIQQVGEQEDGWDARSIRFMARGHFELWRRWKYLVSYEYKGFDKNSDADWSTTDVNVSTDFDFGTLTLGKTKEGFSYEFVGDAANLPHTERWLSPFAQSRNTGVKLSNTFFGERGTWTVGVFNALWTNNESLRQSGTDVTGRLTFLPVWQDDGAHYLHVGAAVRYYGANDNTLRFKGKPASNAASNFVDTGDIAGDHAFNVGLEALWTRRGWSVLAEYAQSTASTYAETDPEFHGWYVTGAWVISGDNRPYDRKVAYARRVQPSNRWGAFEVMARTGRVDLDDAGVSGGTMEGWWVGINWWANRRAKSSITYGDVDLDRGGVAGNTREWIFRLQWIF